MKQIRVAIGVPSYSMHEPAFTRSLRHLREYKSSLPMGDGTITVIECIHMPIDQARNDITSEFLQTPWFTHLLFIDDDMVFGPDALDRLIGDCFGVVGGLCFARSHPYQPLLLRKMPNPGSYGYIYNYKGSPIHEVDATGCGFLLIRRDVLEDIDRCYGKGRWFERMGELSEDYSFCHRAKVSGHRVFVDTRVKTGHVSKVIVDEQFAELNRSHKLDDWGDGT